MLKATNEIKRVVLDKLKTIPVIFIAGSNFEDRSTLSHSLSHFVEEDDAGNSCYNNQRTTVIVIFNLFNQII